MTSGTGEPPRSEGGDGEPTKTPERDRPSRTRQWLELATALAALLMTVGSALVKLLVERLPTLQPIVVVLMVFFVFLSLSALLQLVLYWRDLATPDARAEFLRTLAFGVFLFGVMFGGVLARYFWELFQSGRSVAGADPTRLLLPLVVSLMVFYPLWTMVSGATKNFFAIVAAFQSGFFWQTLLSGVTRFPAGPTP
jgi:hypothetical protein